MRRIIAVLLLALTLIGASVNASPVWVPGASMLQKGNPDAKVWVNTSSKVYHCPGSKWFGKTKAGEYMTQKQAQEKGYRPAYGKACD